MSLTIKPVSPTAGTWWLSVLDPADKRFQGTVSVVVTLEGPTNQIDRIYQESVGTVTADEDFAALGVSAGGGGIEAGGGTIRWTRCRC